MTKEELDLYREFLTESYETLDQLDQDLVALEKAPHNRELLGAVFRCVHTIKGTCAFLGFTRLESVSHAGENLLSLLRNGGLTLDSEMTNGLLAMVDAIRDILGDIDTDGTEGDRDYTSLIGRLRELQNRPLNPGYNPDREMVSTPEAASLESASTQLVVSGAQTSFDSDSATPGIDDTSCDVGDRDSSGRDVQTIRRSDAEGSVRVSVAQLDNLMNLVGELVLTRDQILRHTTGQENAALQATSQRLNIITTELQEAVMKTRMQPIENLWGKLPRVVRDLGTQFSKQVRIEMEGKSTQLDRTILEAIKDPLTHIVRNSVDHGIESPEVRVASGKQAEGRLSLRAYHEGGQVHIEISDDGKGIDPELVKAKAIETGVISADHAELMHDREAAYLIFEPGFSTAAAVTNVSGRGVGMDVVKTNIEKIGGTVDLQSRMGEGTTLKIRIPHALAIIPTLIAATGVAQHPVFPAGVAGIGMQKDACWD